MTTYVTLLNFTDQGLAKITDSPGRLDEARKTLEDMGGRIVQFLLTMGECDAVLIYEAPDDAASARFQLLLGQRGAVRGRTMKAFPEAAYREIVRGLS